MGNVAEYREVVRQLGLGRLRPIVDAVYPLARVRDAYERLERGAQIGKVTVEISESQH
jgi:NADPH:quinone reductase-like Zn-dependent oxidoreductase